METKTKKAPLNKEVQKKLTQEAMEKQRTSEAKASGMSQEKEISFDERIQKFERLKGLATQRERLTQTLTELTKFNYNQDGSSSFLIRDAHHLEFKTTNSNLIKLVTSHLQSTLEKRKVEIEQQIVQFEL
ncbi:hypothetical protein [Zunongwangia sp. HGR-M22]|uniref:hypothetical protein n=1 Tax=Zunongwangia sp. HGR-M22 TaxID=3015168 RepID=UPI0022DCF505|nr:hypothetical protein [Zunongwangia sp. HGR-M22]WBL24222.1 hypothetical protein PBT91_09820 [Zunongwangia sp. HGR-M22]